MKKQLFILFTLAISISAGFAQTYKKDVSSPFFEQVTYQGAFPVSGSTTSITLYGQVVMTTANGDWTAGWTNWDPQNTIYPGDGSVSTLISNGYKTVAGINYSATVRNVSGDISSNTTWGKDDGSEYILMSGAIHVLDGATLTIKPGTVIRGDVSNISFLLVAKGGKLNAVGTPDKPIVFTSNKAPGSRTSGDWAGFLLMGKSQNNTGTNGTGVHKFEALPSDPLSELGGGANFDIHDNSGEMRFLRVEYAGYNYLPDQEINGVTFGAVGDQTRFDFCQVSFSRDDSYEWFGGSSDHKYLIAWAGIDDEFDMDEGYQGRCQFLLGVRKHDIFETSAGGSSHGFEHDNNTGWGTSAQNVIGVDNPQPATRPVISNASIIGPRIGSLPNIASNRFNAGMAFRTGDESCVYNSIVTGYPRQFEFFHNSTALEPAAQEKFIGGPSAKLPSGYVKNEVLNTTLFKDVNDSRASLGSNNGTVQSQNVPAAATFDPTTGNYLAAGTTLNDAGFVTLFALSSFGNKALTSVDVISSVFTSGTYYSGSSNTNGTPVINTPDFTLKSGATTILGSASFTPAILANATISGASAYFFGVGPASLPAITTEKGIPSRPTQVNVSAYGLTGTGIALNLAATNFQISTDEGTTWTATTLSLTGGTIWVRYNNASTGSNSGTLTIAPSDGRITAVVLPLSGKAIEPAVPFVNATTYALTPFKVSALGVTSSAQTFTIAGNLLKDVVTVTAPVNFTVSKDGSNYSSSVTYASSYKLLAPAVVYIQYVPTATNAATVTIGGTFVAGKDTSALTIESNGAVAQEVQLTGTWGFTSQVGPKDANGNIIQNFIVPSFPTFVSYRGVPSPSQVTYIAAQNVPAGQSLVVNALSGLEYSKDNVSFSAASLTFTGTSVPVTPIYVRYKGTGGLGFYANTGGSVVAVGLSGGASTLDKLIGLQGVTENIPTAVALTVTTTGLDNVVSGINTTFTGIKAGSAFYIGGIAVSNFVGVVTSIGDNFTLYLDRNITTAYSTTYALSAANMINAQTNFYESNKDFNRGALIFPSGNLSSATSFDVTSQNAVVVTVSGYTTAATVSVGRDLTTEYSLRYEVSKDGGATWVPSVTLTPANGILAPTPVWVRYNPTGTATSGIINSVATTVTGFGQHTGAIAAGGITIYTIGFSDPILYASSAALSSAPGFNDVVASVNDLRTIANTPSIPVSVQIYGKRLQSDITVTANNNKFELSADGTTWGNTLTLSKNNAFNYNGSVWVRFNPNGVAGPVSSSIAITSTKVSQNILVFGSAVAVPEAFVNSSAATLSVATAGTFTVNGDNLTSVVTITAPAGFEVWAGGSSYGSTATLAPNSLNYGLLSPTAVLVTFTGTTSISGSLLNLSADNASTVSVTLTGVPVSTITGITGEKTISATIYPNPSSGSVTIALADYVDATVAVVSYTGTVVSYGVINGLTHEITGLTPGLYLVKITTKTGSHTAKLVVE